MAIYRNLRKGRRICCLNSFSFSVLPHFDLTHFETKGQLMHVTTSKLDAGGPHLIVSVENFREINSALLFQPALKGHKRVSSHVVRTRIGKKSVWTNGKNDQALIATWVKGQRGKESCRTGQEMDQIINKQQEEDGLAQSGPNQIWKLFFFFVSFFVFLIAILTEN